jgi:hypothetical protein
LISEGGILRENAWFCFDNALIRCLFEALTNKAVTVPGIPVRVSDFIFVMNWYVYNVSNWTLKKLSIYNKLPENRWNWYLKYIVPFINDAHLCLFYVIDLIIFFQIKNIADYFSLINCKWKEMWRKIAPFRIVQGSYRTDKSILNTLLINSKFILNHFQKNLNKTVPKWKHSPFFTNWTFNDCLI